MPNHAMTLTPDNCNIYIIHQRALSTVLTSYSIFRIKWLTWLNPRLRLTYMLLIMGKTSPLGDNENPQWLLDMLFCRWKVKCNYGGLWTWINEKMVSKWQETKQFVRAALPPRYAKQNLVTVELGKYGWWNPIIRPYLGTAPAEPEKNILDGR